MTVQHDGAVQTFKKSASNKDNAIRLLQGNKTHLADPHGIAFDPKFFVQWPAPHRPHQVRLEGGDCSSDSYCYP